jgi:hypothetical protein
LQTQISFISVTYATRRNLYARWHIPCHSLFPRRESKKMKSIHLLLAAVLLMMATVWARAATQGIEQALVSIGIEYGLKVLRARTRALPNIIASI